MRNNYLLLDARVSDDFSFGTTEQFIPHNLENRIIRYKPVLKKSELAKAAEFFKAHHSRYRPSEVNAVGTYLFERFFEKIQSYFDSLSFVNDVPGTKISSGHYDYTFIHDGKEIALQHNGSSIGEISRIVHLQKGLCNHFIVPEIFLGKNKVRGRNYWKKMRGVEQLIEKRFPFVSYNLSYMPVYSHDSFCKAISPNTNYQRLPQECLNNHNLVLVYSLNRASLSELSQRIVSLLSEQQAVRY